MQFSLAQQAIIDHNPELVLARKRNIPILHRSHALFEIMRKFYKTIGITGTHGKTSTTTLVAHIFSQSNLNPSYIIGGKNQYGIHSHCGGSDFCIVEVDESDQSMNTLAANQVLIN